MRIRAVELGAILGVFLIVVGLPARADSASNAVPSVVQVGNTNIIRFTLVGSVAMCSTVSAGSTAWGDIQVGQGGVTSDAHKNMVSVLMAAKLAGRQIKVYATNGTGSQYGCLVTGIELQ